MAMAKIIIDSAQIEAIAKYLSSFLSGSEITEILKDINARDNSGESTKWRRLNSVFKEQQDKNLSCDKILMFIKKAVAPVAYVNEPDKFEDIRMHLNRMLMFSGIEYGSDGNFRKIEAANSITEIQRRTKNLKDKLNQMGVHHRVIRYCNEELLRDNYFHSVLEAAKSLCEFIREKTGLTEDGAALIDKTFSVKQPYLAINSLQTESEKNQQIGLLMMLKGITSMARNVTAHTPKIKWIIEESEAIDILMVISFLHKNLDDCIVVPR